MLFLAKSSFSGLQSSFWHVWLLPQTPPDSADEGAVEQSSFLLSDWLWMWQHDRNPIYWPVLAVCTAVETDSISISMHRSASDPHGVSVHVLFKQSVVVLQFVICDGGFSIPAAHQALQTDCWFPGDPLWAGPEAGWFGPGNQWFALHQCFGLEMIQVKGNKK